MSNSWDAYYRHYSDWDEAHCFNVRLELRFEDQLKNLGYLEYVEIDEFTISEHDFLNNCFPKSKTYIKSKNEITLSFEVPYDWSIDTDWEDKALVLLGLKDEWVIDSSVEDK
tara:strand:+ start:190 stop:525 length:336 start_codon:yes stop_codon:yes gene_type:complete